MDARLSEALPSLGEGGISPSNAPAECRLPDAHGDRGDRGSSGGSSRGDRSASPGRGDRAEASASPGLGEPSFSAEIGDSVLAGAEGERICDRSVHPAVGDSSLPAVGDSNLGSCLAAGDSTLGGVAGGVAGGATITSGHVRGGKWLAALGLLESTRRMRSVRAQGGGAPGGGGAPCTARGI